MAPSGSRAGVRYSGGLSVPLRRLWPVLSTIDLRGSAGPGVDYAAAVPRAGFDVAAAVERVLPICADVAARGEAALAEYSERFDHVVPEHFRVPASALEQAAALLDPDLRKAFEVSIARRRTVSAAELGEAEVRVELAPGAVVTQRMIAVDRVGLYVPGGLAPLASSVIMNVVPAQIAGVRSIALSSPPQREFGGLPHPSILAVCHLLGIEEVYAVGGAQAIAMFAYGVSGLCDRVDLVTGPGNIYVVAAKRALKGRVNIDSEAGPTEIAILADATADPVHVAADLISQAEHDPLAAAVLVTDSEELAEAVRAEVERQVPETKHSERIGQSLAGEQSAIVLVRDVNQGIEVVDAYAAEHLEIQTEHAAAGRGPDPERRGDLRRRLVAGVAGRLRGGKHPRAADRRLRLSQLRPQREELPQGGARDRLQPRGAGRDRPRRRGVRRRRGPAGPWCGDQPPVPEVSERRLEAPGASRGG